jgi:hypothetical protein
MGRRTCGKKHPLRALDVLHPASALFLRERIRSDIFFSSFDGRLNETAKAEGLAVPSAQQESFCCYNCSNKEEEWSL